MRIRIAAIVLGLVLVPSVAQAEEFSSCWVTTVWNPASLQFDQITRCRISGGDVVDYASDSDVPATLSPNLGTDLNGPCWFLTSASTSYEAITRFSDGSAEIGLDTDPSDPFNPLVIVGTYPRCTSEPTVTDPAADAWDYVMSYIHDPPAPDLNPVPGDGITGLETFVGVPVPDDHSASLTSGGRGLDVGIVVDAVVVDWGDGQVNTYPASQEVLAGYPDGSATHTYEVKDSEGADVTVEYDWTARWRVDGGPWTPLPVPNTTTTVVYPIAEVVSRLTN